MKLESINDTVLIGSREAAKLLGIGPHKVYQLWKEGRLVCWQIGATKKTTKEAIRKFLLETQEGDSHNGSKG